MKLILLVSIILTSLNSNFLIVGDHQNIGESFVTIITKLIPQNVPATATTTTINRSAKTIKVVKNSSNFVHNKNGQNLPTIYLRRQHPASSWNLRAACVGDGVTSLSAVQCVSPADCERFLGCLDLNSTCPKNPQIIYRGKPCPASKIGPESPHSCFLLDDRRWQLSSGLIECTARNDQEGVPGSNFRRSVQEFFKGPDNFFHLVKTANKKNQITLQVREDNSKIGSKIEYVGRPIFYTNRKVRVNCRATKFLFKAIKLSLVKIDGSTYPISVVSYENSTSFESGSNTVENFGVEFYLEVFDKALELTTDMVGIVCAAQQRDNLMTWTESIFKFIVREPSRPMIDKSIKLRVGKNQKKPEVTCSYTGGPSTVQIIREADGRNVIDPDIIRSDGPVREHRSQSNMEPHLYEGNFTCIVTNSMDSDSFQFYQDFSKRRSISYPADSPNAGSLLANGISGVWLSTIIFVVICAIKI